VFQNLGWWKESVLETKVFAGKMRSLRYTGKVAIRVLGGGTVPRK
jgi:hypothetical protein